MSILVACPCCARHIRPNELACPFLRSHARTSFARRDRDHALVRDRRPVDHAGAHGLPDDDGALRRPSAARDARARQRCDARARERGHLRRPRRRGSTPCRTQARRGRKTLARWERSTARPRRRTPRATAAAERAVRGSAPSSRRACVWRCQQAPWHPPGLRQPDFVCEKTDCIANASRRSVTIEPQLASARANARAPVGSAARKRADLTARGGSARGGSARGGSARGGRARGGRELESEDTG
jgi:hypothetical protein